MKKTIRLQWHQKVLAMKELILRNTKPGNNEVKFHSQFFKNQSIMVKDNNFDVEKWLCSSVEIWAIKHRRYIVRGWQNTDVQCTVREALAWSLAKIC